jgi:hypothetical protein
MLQKMWLRKTPMQLQKYLVRKIANARAQHIECANEQFVQIKTHFNQLFFIQTGKGSFPVNTPAAWVNAGAGEQSSFRFR